MGLPSDQQYDPTIDDARHMRFDQPTFRLFTNDFTPDASSVIADFTEADFDGYEELLVFGSLFENDADSLFEKQHPAAVFAHDGTGTAQTIYGWYATGNVNNPASATHTALQTEVMACERFASPITLPTDQQSIRIQLHEHLVGVAD